MMADTNSTNMTHVLTGAENFKKLDANSILSSVLSSYFQLSNFYESSNIITLMASIRPFGVTTSA